MHIKFDEQPPIGEPGHPLVMRRLVDRERHGDAMSITWIQIWGEHRRLRTDASQRAYVILNGSGRFQWGEEEPVTAGAGDVVLIPRGVDYELSGWFTYLVINAPAFADGDDIYAQ
jgi:mannose-6-phosphate isomerase-like protein (cupin superfamily)